MSSKKKKNPYGSLKNRKPVWEYAAATRKEKFNGPGDYDLKDDPKRVKTFSISHAPRFPGADDNHHDAAGDTSQQDKVRNEKKKKAEEHFQAELKKKFGSKKMPEPHASDGVNTDILFKGVEKPPRAVDFSLSHQPRFDWEQQKILEEMRQKRDEKLMTANPDKPLIRKANTSPSKDLDVDKAFHFVRERCLTPVIRPESDKEERERREREIQEAKKKPLTKEEKERIAAVENHGTIAGFVRATRKGDFSRGAEREAGIVGIQKDSSSLLSSPKTVYEPNFDAIKPKVPVPIIQPLTSENNHQDQALRERIAQSEREVKLAALSKKYEEAVKNSSDRAMQQLDKSSTHRRSPGVFMTSTPISAEMPLAYNSGNFWNSRSMRAILCDTDGVKVECEALKKLNPGGASSPSPASTKKSSSKQRKRPSSAQTSAATPDAQKKLLNDDDTETTKNNTKEKDENKKKTENYSELFQEAFASPFSRKTPQPKTKISITSPFFGNDFGGMSNTAAGSISRHLLSSERNNNSGKNSNNMSSSLTRRQSQQFDDDQDKGQHEAADFSTHRNTQDASVFSDGTSPAIINLASTNNFNARVKPNTTMHWNYSGKGGLTNNNNNNNNNEARAGSGIPLSSLLKKKTLKTLTVFTSIYDELGGRSKQHLDDVERELYH